MNARTLVAAALLVVGLTGCGSGATAVEVGPRAAAEPAPVAAPPRGTFSVEEAKEFRPFPVYYLGSSYEGLPLVATLREKGRPVPGEPIAANTVAFVYGDCEPTGDAGCAPPLVVETWPACRRNPSVYTLTPYSPYPVDEKRKVRGVPAFFYDGHGRLELSTGRVTVVLHSDGDRARGRKFLLRAALALEPVNAPASRRLPPPAPGALAGELKCRAGE